MSWLSAVLTRPPFSVKPAALLAGAEVAERQVAGLAAVAGVGALEAERPHHEAQRTIGRRRRRPRDVPPERAPERRVGEAADGVDHLQVEAAVGRRRRQPARQQQVRIVEVERLGHELLGRAGAVHREERSDRARLELLVGHLHGRDAAHAIRHRRIERVDPQRPHERRARVALIRPNVGLKAHAIADVVRLNGRRGLLPATFCLASRHNRLSLPRDGHPFGSVLTTSRSGDCSTIRSACPPSRARTTSAPSVIVPARRLLDVAIVRPLARRYAPCRQPRARDVPSAVATAAACCPADDTQPPRAVSSSKACTHPVANSRFSMVLGSRLGSGLGSRGSSILVQGSALEP